VSISNNQSPSRKAKILASTDFQFFSVKEVAIILETTTKTVHEWIKEGKLPAFKVGNPTRLTRIRRQDLEKFIDNHIRPNPTAS